MLNSNELGLSSIELAQLRSIFEMHHQIAEAIVYGSRAKGTYTSKSDIDLALVGEALDRHVVARVALELDSSDLIYNVDVLNLTELRNPRLLEHIQRVGVCIYKREQ